MALGQALLDRMEVLDNELQLQPTEANVARGLLALNIAQDYFETLVAEEPDLFGDTSNTVTTTADTETTAFPTGVLRLDLLQMINPATSRPWYDLGRLGGPPAQGHPWAWLVGGSISAGRPIAYWTNARNIYWSPLPDATHTVRWHGFQTAADITAAGTFAYPDSVMTPLASFATIVMKLGVGDQTGELASIAQATFGPVVKSLANFNRNGARPFNYTYTHTT